MKLQVFFVKHWVRFSKEFISHLGTKISGQIFRAVLKICPSISQRELLGVGTFKNLAHVSVPKWELSTCKSTVWWKIYFHLHAALILRRNKETNLDRLKKPPSSKPLLELS